MKTIEIRLVTQDHIQIITHNFEFFGYPKNQDMFASYWFEHNEGSRVVWIAYDKEHYVIVGYVTLLSSSKYKSFYDAHIPEIKDLNVVPSYRKRGIGSLLLDAAERKAFERSESVGIGVGLPWDY